jgi:hypothetical protein
MSRSLIALAVAALAVVCLGTLTVTHRRTELLVGSYHVGRAPGAKEAPHQPAGYGNQAAQNGFNPGFYNGLRHAHGIKAHMGQKSLVGSYNVGRTPGKAATPHQPAGIGNQAAQNGFNPGFYNGLRHAHGAKPRMGRKSLVGSQVVTPMVGKKHHQTEKRPPVSAFIGDQMKNSARKSHVQKLLVGSTYVDPRKQHGKPAPHHFGIGNQAAPHYGDAHQFYNAARKVKTNKLLVGSQFVDPKDPNAKHQQPHGYGNQAAQMGDNPGFYNAPSRKSKSQKLLVGSFNVNPQQKAAPHPGIGNQAAPQNHFDVGTNIVFHGIKSEGGIRGAKKVLPHHAQKKGLVGSYNVGKPRNGKVAHQPHGIGDQSASRGNNPAFYNGISH